MINQRQRGRPPLQTWAAAAAGRPSANPLRQLAHLSVPPTNYTWRRALHRRAQPMEMQMGRRQIRAPSTREPIESCWPRCPPRDSNWPTGGGGGRAKKEGGGQEEEEARRQKTGQDETRQDKTKRPLGGPTKPPSITLCRLLLCHLRRP